MNDVPDIISYDGKEFILWETGVWKVERQGDILLIYTPDGEPVIAAKINAADMLAMAIENVLMQYYFEKGTNGK